MTNTIDYTESMSLNLEEMLWFNVIGLKWFMLLHLIDIIFSHYLYPFFSFYWKTFQFFPLLFLHFNHFYCFPFRLNDISIIFVSFEWFFIVSFDLIDFIIFQNYFRSVWIIFQCFSPISMLLWFFPFLKFYLNDLTIFHNWHTFN